MSRAADVAEALAGRKLDVLAHLLPAGKVRGHEYEAGNLKGEPGRSLKVHLNGKGCPWSDFATGERGGDLLDLWAAARTDGDKGAALREAAAWLGLEREQPRGRRRDGPRETKRAAATPTGAPAAGRSEPPEPTAADWRWRDLDPVATFTYRDEHGRALYHVGRYESGATKPNGKAAKDYVPLTWAGRRWEHKRPGDPVLYNLPEIATHPVEGWLVFCEGEKKVDAARDLFERDLWRFTFTTWMGGPGQIKDQDFGRAAGHHVIVAADADDEGAKTALELAAALEPVAKLVKVWQPPPAFRALKKGWDLADAAEGLLPDGWDQDRIAYALQAAPTPAQLRLGALGIISGADLLAKELPDPSFVVPGFITEGCNILAGRPKMGKSWLALAEGCGVAAGRSFLTGEDIEAGDVLVLALEDNERRLKKRLRAILQGAAAPPGISVVTRWRKADEGGLDDLRLWIKEHPRAKLVAIDTLEKLRGRRDRNAGIYGDDYAALSAIKQLADETGVAILVVHHVRKGESEDPVEMVSGSTGLTGAVDTILVLKRDRGRADATLFVTGRDVEEAEKALAFDKDTGRWTLIGDAEEYRRSQERNEILRLLASAEAPMTPKEVADGLQKRRENVKVLLRKMLRDGLVIAHDGGRYSCRP